MYEFTEDCRLGIPEIDKEHQHLFSLVNDGYLLLSLNKDLRPAARNLLKHLKDYANTHFDHEEAYMKKIDDPELPSQIQEHKAFITRINNVDFSNLAEAQVKPALENLLEYLSRWLLRHIIGSDTLIGKYESPFAFTSKYMTGIDDIDIEHRRLFEMVKETNDILHDDLIFDKYDKFLSILSQLKTYAREHFSHEEAYMEEINYPDILKQKEAHAAFCDKLAEIKLEEIDENQQEALENLVSFLLNWLSTHILRMDKAIGDYLSSQLKEPMIR